MDLPTYRQQQAHSFYEQIANSTNPVFQQWDDPQAPLPQIGGEPRGVSGFPFQGDNALQLMMAATSNVNAKRTHWAGTAFTSGVFALAAFAPKAFSF